MLVGQSKSNVHDGDKDLGDNFILKGIDKRSDVGFLTYFEYFGYFTVGENYKTPRVPIWIVQSESHYSVLFALDDLRPAASRLASSRQPAGRRPATSRRWATGAHLMQKTNRVLFFALKRKSKRSKQNTLFLRQPNIKKQTFLLQMISGGPAGVRPPAPP